MLMQIIKYIPEKLYGFVAEASSSNQRFFHLGAFDPNIGWVKNTRCEHCSKRGCLWSPTSPPPILGEEVEVTSSDISLIEGKAPKASRVERIVAPKALSGVVETFDNQRGYGFVLGEDEISYHLHRSEVIEGRIPLPGQRVMFYAGRRLEKPRACHVFICPIY